MPRVRNNHLRLAQNIFITGEPMPLDHSCSACQRSVRAGNKTSCVVSESPTRCSECVRRKYPDCDVKRFTIAELDKVEKQRQKIDKELEKAEEILEEYLEGVEKASARVRRLRKNQKLLRDREQEVVRRGIREVDEEDGVTPSDLDFSSFPWDEALLDSPDFSFGTPGVPSHNGSNS